MEVTALTKDAYHALLRRLQGSGYTQDPDSARDQELGAVAEIAKKAAEGLVRVSRNFFLGSAEEALDLYERVRFVVGSSGLATARRQWRLVALAQGLPLVEARLRNAIAIYRGVSTGVTLRPTEANLVAHGASPLGALVVGRRERAASKHDVRDLDPLLDRGLAGRAISGGISTFPDEAVSETLVYDDELDEMPRAINLVTVVTLAAQTKARAAPIAFHPGAVVTRNAWIELQAMLLYKSRGFSVDQLAQGRTFIYDDDLTASATAVIDLGVSFAQRLVSAWGAIGADGPDFTALDAAKHVWLAPSKLGPAGTGPVHEIAALNGTATDVTVHVDGSSHLVITNGGATRHVSLLVHVTPPYTEGSSTDAQPWIDTGAIRHDDLAELYASTVVGDHTAAGTFFGGDVGALRRIVYTGGLTRETGTGSVRHVLLDSSEDYRLRFVLVVPLTFPVATGVEAAYYPHAGTDGLVPRSLIAEAPRLFFTGSGVAAGSDAAEAYQHPDRLTSPDVWIFADEDGNLCAEMKAVSAHKSACLMALIIATERIDESAVVTPVPVHSTHVQTVDLEQPQHCGVFAQGFQGGVPRYSPASPSPRAVPTSPPLGLIAEGHAPRRPVSWLVRERLGSVVDSTHEVRQPILGQRKRLLSLTLVAGELTPVDDFNVPTELAPGVNDQLDFRDRFVWVEGRYATTDITVGGDPGADDDAATPFFAAFYTGPWADVEVAISADVALVFEFSRTGGYHARLCFQNDGEDDVYLNASIECSGHVGLTDLRLYGVINAWTCASADELEFDENFGCSNDFGITGGSLSPVW